MQLIIGTPNTRNTGNYREIPEFEVLIFGLLFIPISHSSCAVMALMLRMCQSSNEWS